MKRALISVHDKTGVVELASALSALGFDIISTGGTAELLAREGVSVKGVSEVTGFPEMMGGRVKTLHPKIHGGILARRDDEGHLRDAAASGIEMIDLVAVNLYPFEKTVAREGVSLEDAIEQIDIGGPAMVRSAAKNYKHVCVVTDPSDYGDVLSELERFGDLSIETRQRLAVKAFRLTAGYDAAIERFLSREMLGEEVLTLRCGQGRRLRYGENWHQRAMVYSLGRSKMEPSAVGARQHHGRELSYNNLLDSDSAIQAAADIAHRPGVVIVKHTNPCGYASAQTISGALKAAWEGDPVSAFGGIIAFTRPMDALCEEFLRGKRVDVIISPGYREGVIESLKRKGKDLILLETPPFASDRYGTSWSYRGICGGILEQDLDLQLFDRWETVTQAQFPQHKRRFAEFAWIAAKHTKSNAIVIAVEHQPREYMVLGMGAGQPNRVDSLKKLALTKARENLQRWREAENSTESDAAYERRWLSEAVVASDAFLPFSDTAEAAAEAGIRYLVQPGGSVKDAEVIACADRLGLAMVFTGMRHFKH